MKLWNTDKKVIWIDYDGRSALVCDNTQCDYEAPRGEFVFGQHLIGMPCPQCGESLLTRKDYEDSQKFFNLIEWINRWFGPWFGHTYEQAMNSDKFTSWSMRNHDGKLIVKDVGDEW